MPPDLPSEAAAGAASLLLLVGLWAIESLGLGVLVARRLAWEPLEKLLLTVLVSHGSVYGTQVAITLAHGSPRWMWLVAVANLVGLFLGRRELARWWADPDLRSTLAPFGVFALGLLLLASTLRHFSGGSWYGDWFEHYERAIFFLEQRPPSARFLEDLYPLGARPPFLNALAAGLMAQTGAGFPHFQLALALCNLMVFPPAALLARRLHRLGPWWLTALLLLTPFVFQNFTFTWTRTYTSFLTLSGIAFYLRTWGARGEPEPWRFATAFAFLAAAVITHYSAGPYLVFLAAHYVLFVWRRSPEPARAMALVAGVGALVLLAWFGWSVWLLGIRETLGSNTTARGFGGRTLGEAASVIAGNVYATLVPMSLRGMPVPLFAGLESPIARLRDQWFYFYQNNAFGMLGLSAPFVACYAALSDLAAGCLDRGRAAFWTAFIAWTVVAGVGVVATAHPVGLAPICLQPLALLVLAYLAGRAPGLPLPALVVLVAGKLVDGVLGVGLQAHVESQSLPVIVDPQRIAIAGDLGRVATKNFAAKLRHGYLFLGDLAPQALLLPAQLVSHSLALGALVQALRLTRQSREPAPGGGPRRPRSCAGRDPGRP